MFVRCSLVLVACVMSVGLAACSRGPQDHLVIDPGSPGDRDAGPAPDANGTRTDASFTDVTALPTDDVVVWAHSRDTLYSFDPRALVVAEVGWFTSADGDVVPPITDLAVDENGVVYACGQESLFRVDTSSAELTWLCDFSGGGNFTALSFLPGGVLGAGGETLVGASDTDYYEIDRSACDVTWRGSYSDGYLSSGDIVSVRGAGTFATVKRYDLDSDLLVRLEPSTGEAAPVGSGIGYSRIFGLGYWRNRLFGFTNAGELIEVNIATGVGTVVNAATGASSFWGAGVTTIAPTGPF